MKILFFDMMKIEQKIIENWVYMDMPFNSLEKILFRFQKHLSISFLGKKFLKNLGNFSVKHQWVFPFQVQLKIFFGNLQKAAQVSYSVDFCNLLVPASADKKTADMKSSYFQNLKRSSLWFTELIKQTFWKFQNNFKTFV